MDITSNLANSFCHAALQCPPHCTVTKGKKEEFGGKKIPGKIQHSKLIHFFILVSDLDSDSVTVSDLDNNILWFWQLIIGCPNQIYVLYTTDGPCQDI